MGKSRVSGTLKIAVAQTLDLFAIATQEPYVPEAGGSNDRGDPAGGGGEKLHDGRPVEHGIRCLRILLPLKTEMTGLRLEPVSNNLATYSTWGSPVPAPLPFGKLVQ